MQNWLNGEAKKIAEGTKVKYKSFFKKTLQTGYVAYDGGGDYLLLSDSPDDVGSFSVSRSDIVRIAKKTKRWYAEQIEAHSLYTPRMDGVYSKNYYKYSPAWEIEHLMKDMKLEELKDYYESGYGEDGRELSRYEIAW